MPKTQPSPLGLDGGDELQRILDFELFDRDARWPAPAMATALGSNRRPTPSDRPARARREWAT